MTVSSLHSGVCLLLLTDPLQHPENPQRVVPFVAGCRPCPLRKGRADAPIDFKSRIRISYLLLAPQPPSLPSPAWRGRVGRGEARHQGKEHIGQVAVIIIGPEANCPADWMQIATGPLRRPPFNSLPAKPPGAGGRKNRVLVTCSMGDKSGQRCQAMSNPHTIVENRTPDSAIYPGTRPVVEVAGRRLRSRVGKKFISSSSFTQHSGSFKARGAFANLLMRDVGLAARRGSRQSGGNHGRRRWPYAAHKLKVRAKIFVPEVFLAGKRLHASATTAADLVVGGRTVRRRADRQWKAWADAKWRDGPCMLSTRRRTLLGQGTIGMELSDSGFPILTTPPGGGGRRRGLIGGIAAWFSGKVRIVAVEPEAAAPHCIGAFAGPVGPSMPRAGGIAGGFAGAGRAGR